MHTKLKTSGSASVTELWFEPRQPEDLFAPLAHNTAALFANVDRSRVRKCDQCVLHFHDTSKKGTAALVQHATMREPPQGRSLRGAPTHAAQDRQQRIVRHEIGCALALLWERSQPLQCFLNYFTLLFGTLGLRHGTGASAKPLPTCGSSRFLRWLGFHRRALASLGETHFRILLMILPISSEPWYAGWERKSATARCVFSSVRIVTSTSGKRRASSALSAKRSRLGSRRPSSIAQCTRRRHSSVALGDHELISFQCHLDTLRYVEDTVFQSCRSSR